MRFVKTAMERRLSSARVSDFVRDGLTSSVVLNVILPLLCDLSNVKRLPDSIRGELNRLRKLRNELVHDGLNKDAVSKQLATEMLCATVFGFEYLRYWRSIAISPVVRLRSDDGAHRSPVVTPRFRTEARRCS